MESTVNLNKKNLLDFASVGQGDAGMLIHELCAKTEVTVSTIHTLNKIRNLLIEQIAFTELNFLDGNLNKDIYTMGYLKGQLTLITNILTSLPGEYI